MDPFTSLSTRIRWARQWCLWPWNRRHPPSYVRRAPGQPGPFSGRLAPGIIPSLTPFRFRILQIIYCQIICKKIIYMTIWNFMAEKRSSPSSTAGLRRLNRGHYSLLLLAAEKANHIHAYEIKRGEVGAYFSFSWLNSNATNFESPKIRSFIITRPCVTFHSRFRLLTGVESEPFAACGRSLLGVKSWLLIKLLCNF